MLLDVPPIVLHGRSGEILRGEPLTGVPAEGDSTSGRVGSRTTGVRLRLVCGGLRLLPRSKPYGRPAQVIDRRPLAGRQVVPGTPIGPALLRLRHDDLPLYAAGRSMRRVRRGGRA